MSRTPKYSELKQISDEELQRSYDARAVGVYAGLDFYLDELSRRALAKESDLMLKRTETMARLTWVIVAFTAINLLLVGAQLWLAFNPV